MESETRESTFIPTRNSNIHNSKTHQNSSLISSGIDDDDEVLLCRDERVQEEDNESLKSRMKQRKWWFYAEFVIFFYAFCDYPNNFVSQKFSLDQITLQNWEYDLQHNITHDFDIFNSSTSGNSCALNTSSDAFKFSQRNQMMTSHFLMIRTSVWVVPAMLSNLLFGSLSDTFGRRWIFIPPLLGSFSWSVILCLLTFYKADIYYMLIIDVLNGMGGAFACIIVASVVYIAGQTSSKKRLLRLTLLQVFFLMAASISPPIMGELLDHLGTPITLLITSCISGCNVLYCIIFLPNMPEHKQQSDESRKSSSRHIASRNTIHNNDDDVGEGDDCDDDDRLIDAANPDENLTKRTNACRLVQHQLANTVELYARNRKWLMKRGLLHIVKEDNEELEQDTKAHPMPNNAVRLRILLLGFFTVCVPLFDPGVVLNLFLLNSPLCWSQSVIGWYTGLSTLVCAVGSVSLTKLFEMCLDHTSIAIICCIVCAVSRAYIFFVQNSFMMFLGVAFLPLTNILLPSIRTMMTLLVPSSKHGCVLGSLGAVEVFCCYTAAILFNEVYSATLFISTAFVFLVSGAIFFLSIIIFVVYKVKYKNIKAIHFTDSLVIPA